MNPWVQASVVVAAVTTGILPLFLERSRRLIGAEPSPSLLTYVLILTPRWIATGFLVMHLVSRGDGRAASPDLFHYLLACMLHVLAGLVSFFSIAVAPPDLKAVPYWVSRWLVSLGFIQPAALVVLCIWLLGGECGVVPTRSCWGPAAGWLFVVSLGFGASVFLWALAFDLRDQARLGRVHARPSSQSSASGRNAP